MKKVLKKINKYFKKKWQVFALILVAIVFFIGTSSFNYFTQSYSNEGDFVKWASPDETANYIFAKYYGQEGVIPIYEQYNLYTKDIMHPRSFRSDHGKLKPVSFLGIILIYGKIVSWTSYKVMPYLTPFFASIGLIYFYLLIKRFFSKNNALISTIILASFPPFVYYTARSMFHNVLFTVFLIIGFYYSLKAFETRRAKFLQKKTNRGWRSINFKTLKEGFASFVYTHNGNIDWLGIFYIFLSGVFIGGAIITRTSELMWLGPVLFVIWIFNIRRIGLTKLIIFLSGVFLSLTPALYYNEVLYGNYYFGGYSEMNNSILNLATASSDLLKSTAQGQATFFKETFKKISDNIFYFGLHPRQSLRMLDHYFIKMFPWLFYLSILGFVLFLQGWRKIKKRHIVYLLSALIFSAVLVFYYGSWEFFDNPDPNSYTIGNSYTRYWLPIYLASMPFLSLFLIRLTGIIFSFIKKTKGESRFYSFKTSKKFLSNSLMVIVLIFITYFSLNFVLVGSEEGLVFQVQRQLNSRTEWKEVIALTENNSAIVTQYHDKLFFPERKVIVGGFGDVNMLKEYRNLVSCIPVYYYNFSLGDIDIEYLNNRRLKESDLRIDEVSRVTKDFTLYKLSESIEEISSSTLEIVVTRCPQRTTVEKN